MQKTYFKLGDPDFNSSNDEYKQFEIGSTNGANLVINMGGAVISNNATPENPNPTEKQILMNGQPITEVIANPEVTGEETDLTALQVGETKYKIAASGGGTDVEANPEIIETDPDLTGIKIGENKYRVSQINADPDISGWTFPVYFVPECIQINGENFRTPSVIRYNYEYDTTAEDKRLVCRRFNGISSSGRTVIDVTELGRAFWYEENVFYIIYEIYEESGTTKDTKSLEFFYPEKADFTTATFEFYSKTHKMTITPTSVSDMTPVVTITDLE